MDDPINRTPVSYTHLDVYKRQANMLQRTNKLCRKFIYCHIHKQAIDKVTSDEFKYYLSTR